MSFRTNRGSIRYGGLWVRRERGVADGSAQEVERLFERFVVLFLLRDEGLRAGFLVALSLEMSSQGCLALGVGARLQVVRHVLQDFDVRGDAFGLNRPTRGCVVAGRGQPQGAVAGPKRNDGLHRALAE